MKGWLDGQSPNGVNPNPNTHTHISAGLGIPDGCYLLLSSVGMCMIPRVIAYGNLSRRDSPLRIDVGGNAWVGGFDT
jgi:hypothetical protein